MSIYTTSGITVDDDPETEDLELVADQWSLLADVFASGEFCSGCVYNKSRGTGGGCKLEVRQISVLARKRQRGEV